MAYTSYSENQYRIQRTNPKTGFTEKIWYTGSIRNIPNGWQRCQDRH